MLHHTFEFEGKKINYQDEGDGKEVLVLVHGFMNDLSVWQRYVLDYMHKIRVITVDLIGHGESELCGEVSSMEKQAKMIKCLLNMLDIKHVVMCGHSMGGMITLAFEELFGGMLKGYCLMNSQAMADNAKSKENRLRAIERAYSERIQYVVDFIPNLFAKENRIKFAEEIEDLKAIGLNMKPDGIIAAQKGMIERRDRCDVLAKSSCPVMFVSGREDPRINAEDLYAQACLPKVATTLMLPCGHMAYIEEEQWVKSTLLNFTDNCFRR